MDCSLMCSIFHTIFLVLTLFLLIPKRHWISAWQSEIWTEKSCICFQPTTFEGSAKKGCSIRYCVNHMFGHSESILYLDMWHSSLNCYSAGTTYSLRLNGNTKPSRIHWRINSFIFRTFRIDGSDNANHPPQTLLGRPTNAAYDQNAKVTAFVHFL